MIQVIPIHISIKPQQTSFDFAIHNNAHKKVYFKIKSNNIEAVAPCTQFGQIKVGQFAKVLVKVLVNYSFQLKMAVEYCEVEQNDTLRIDNWKNIKSQKHIIVIFVQKPDIAQSISNRSFRVENDKSQQKLQGSGIKIMKSYVMNSSNLINPIENSLKRSFIKTNQPIQQKYNSNQQLQNSIIRKSRNQMRGSEIKPRYVNQPIQTKQVQQNFAQRNSSMYYSGMSKQNRMVTYNPRYQIAVSYTVIVLGSMLFFGLGYLWGILGG